MLEFPVPKDLDVQLCISSSTDVIPVCVFKNRVDLGGYRIRAEFRSGRYKNRSGSYENRYGKFGDQIWKF